LPVGSSPPNTSPNQRPLSEYSVSARFSRPFHMAVIQTLLGSSSEDTYLLRAKATFGNNTTIVDPDTGDKYMTQQDFVNAIAPEREDYHKIPRSKFAILFNVADCKKAGRIGLNEWISFQNLLAKPEAEYEIAFRLFDTDGNGSISWSEFQEGYAQRTTSDSIPFNWNCPWASLYLGGSKTRHDMSYNEFSQLLRGLQGERVRQAFAYFDKNGTGYITPDQFARIIHDTSAHKLSDALLANLHTISNVTKSQKISYADVRAFLNLLREMDSIGTIVENASRKTPNGKITKSDFLNEASRSMRFSMITPMETALLFHFASLDNPSGRLSVSDFEKVVDASWREPLTSISKPRVKSKSDSASFLHDVAQSLYHFTLGAFAGAFGATIVYPIDLIKTRMQNQRSKVVGELLYKNSIDCAKKVITNEGVKGLYSGLLPQLVGVAPEKAIKLTVNDLIRNKAKGKDGRIALPFEILAGATAGGCQVIFTNPLEIVKIRLQIQGEVAKQVEGVPKRSALWHVKNLGLLGLYKGASACLLRDIPFSAIYFPTYAHVKKDWYGEGPTQRLGIIQLLISGAVAGAPAAALTTPADVIKTRLQAELRKGQTNYRNIPHAFTTILKEEGIRALFKGAGARVLRSSPQFGATLACYEVLQSLIKFPGSETKPLVVSAMKKESDLGYLRSRNALKLILDMDSNFGRVPTGPVGKE
ncbi:Calcium-binding mitochondrial carrier protein Aralar1, partial [Neolecta irregularis DAH-3]